MKAEDVSGMTVPIATTVELTGVIPFELPGPQAVRSSAKIPRKAKEIFLIISIILFQSLQQTFDMRQLCTRGLLPACDHARDFIHVEHGE